MHYGSCCQSNVVSYHFACQSNHAFPQYIVCCAVCMSAHESAFHANLKKKILAFT